MFGRAARTYLSWELAARERSLLGEGYPTPTGGDPTGVWWAGASSPHPPLLTHWAPGSLIIVTTLLTERSPWARPRPSTLPELTTRTQVQQLLPFYQQRDEALPLSWGAGGRAWGGGTEAQRGTLACSASPSRDLAVSGFESRAVVPYFCRPPVT